MMSKMSAETQTLITELRAELRTALQDCRSWRRFLAVEKWAANRENNPRLGELLRRWEEAYDEMIEEKCNGKY